MKKYQTEQIADFVRLLSFGYLASGITDQLKRHLLDALGSLIYAQTSPTILKLASGIRILQSGGTCKTPMLGNLPLDRAGQWYTALICYPDFMDNFIGKEATCHPSENIGPLLAATQHLNLNGTRFSGRDGNRIRYRMHIGGRNSGHDQRI